MLTKTIYLNRHKAKKYDYKEFMAKYDDKSSISYKMLVGTPLLICVEGTHIEANQLTELCKPHLRMTVNRFIMSLRNPSLYNRKPVDEEVVLGFKWAD